eukprot:PITA_30182
MGINCLNSKTASWLLCLAFVVTYCCVGVISGEAVPEVTAMFIFGDSLIDNGNNNYIASIAKANFLPYGIDFLGGRPTGRFCNGRTTVDFLGQLLGLPLIPAYLDPSTRGSAILNGVNYASAAAGILDETGQNLIGRISLNQQIANFGKTLEDLASQLGSAVAVAQHLAKSIFSITFGSNDYINNYLMPAFYPTSRQYTPETYSDILMWQLSQQLVALYNLGARKFAVAAMGPLGCIPSQIAMSNSNGSCIDSVNQHAILFNSKLKYLLGTLSLNMPGAHFVYGDAYSAVKDMIDDPSSYGFSVTNQGCCGIGMYNGQITCLPGLEPCMNRDQHVFWDAFHPTEAVNIILATRAYSGPPSDSYPINLKQLAQI